MTELELKLARALHAIENIHIGVYPASCNDVPRTERQTGWNAARRAYAKEIHAVIGALDEESTDAIIAAVVDRPLQPHEMQVKVLDTRIEVSEKSRNRHTD